MLSVRTAPVPTEILHSFQYYSCWESLCSSDVPVAFNILSFFDTDIVPSQQTPLPNCYRISINSSGIKSCGWLHLTCLNLWILHQQTRPITMLRIRVKAPFDLESAEKHQHYFLIELACVRNNVYRVFIWMYEENISTESDTNRIYRIGK